MFSDDVGLDGLVFPDPSSVVDSLADEVSDLYLVLICFSSDRLV